MSSTNAPFSRTAIAAVLCSVFPPLAFVLVLVAWMQINDSNGALRGRGLLALALVLSVFVVPAIALVIAFGRGFGHAL